MRENPINIDLYFAQVLNIITDENLRHHWLQHFSLINLFEWTRRILIGLISLEHFLQTLIGWRVKWDGLFKWFESISVHHVINGTQLNYVANQLSPFINFHLRIVSISLVSYVFIRDSFESLLLLLSHWKLSRSLDFDKNKSQINWYRSIRIVLISVDNAMMIEEKGQPIANMRQ